MPFKFLRRKKADKPKEPAEPVAAKPRDPKEPEPIAWWMNVAGSLCLGLMCWGAYSALPRHGFPEKSLRSELSVPKLKAAGTHEWHTWTSPVEPPRPALPDPIVAPPKFEPTLPLPPIPDPPAFRPEPPMAPPPIAAEPTLPALPDKLDPLVFAHRGESGDTPMLRNWKMLALASIMASAAPMPMINTPVFAQGFDDSKIIERLDKLDKSINASIKALGEDVASLRTELGKVKVDVADSKVDLDLVKKAVDALRTEKLNLRIDLEKQIANVRGDLESLRTQIRNLPTGGPAVPPPPVADKSSLEDIKSKLGNIEQAILKLQPNQNRIALAPPTTTPPTTTTGRVMLVNLHSEELLFVVNNKTHRVGPGSSLPLDTIPAGSLSYEVLSPTWGLRARNSTTLAANETFTLTAR
ncbi:MAG: hypothetical protein U0744_13365 [Gemmataceae bacterium]